MPPLKESKYVYVSSQLLTDKAIKQPSISEKKKCNFVSALLIKVLNRTTVCAYCVVLSNKLKCVYYTLRFIIKTCIAQDKGGLISESFSLWLKSPKKGAKNYPEHYPSKENMLRIVIWHFLGEIWFLIINSIKSVEAMLIFFS